jgi:hypothetical protein
MAPLGKTRSDNGDSRRHRNGPVPFLTAGFGAITGVEGKTRGHKMSSFTELRVPMVITVMLVLCFVTESLTSGILKQTFQGGPASLFGDGKF